MCRHLIGKCCGGGQAASWRTWQVWGDTRSSDRHPALIVIPAFAGMTGDGVGFAFTPPGEDWFRSPANAGAEGHKRDGRETLSPGVRRGAV